MKHPRVCVIGLGRFGSALATELSRKGCSVTAIDRREELLAPIVEWVDEPVIANVTDQTILPQLHLERFDWICVASGKDLLPGLAVASALGPERLDRIYCRPVNEVHRFMLERLGIEHILEVEALAATHAAARIDPVD